MGEKQILFQIPIGKEQVAKHKEHGLALQSPTSQRLMTLLRNRQLNEIQSQGISPQNNDGAHHNTQLSRTANKDKKIGFEKSNEQDDSKKIRNDHNFLKDQMNERKQQMLASEKSLDLNFSEINSRNKDFGDLSNRPVNDNEGRTSENISSSKSFWKKQEDKFNAKRSLIKGTFAQQEIPPIDISAIHDKQDRLSIQEGEVTNIGVTNEKSKKNMKQKVLLDTVVSAENELEDVEQQNQKKKQTNNQERQKRVSNVLSDNDKSTRRGSNFQDGNQSRKESNILMEDAVIENQFENSRDNMILQNKQIGLSLLKGLKKKMLNISRDDTINQAIAILMQKHSDHRNQQDIQILMRSVRKIPFFQKMEGKVYVIQNICKSLQYQFVPKGRVVYYQGDAADSFFITMKGKIAILTLKRPQDIISEEAQTNNKLALLPKDKQKFTIRIRLIQRCLIKSVQRLTNVLFFYQQLKAKALILSQLPQHFNFFNVYSSHAPTSMMLIPQNLINHNNSQASLQNENSSQTNTTNKQLPIINSKNGEIINLNQSINTSQEQKINAGPLNLYQNTRQKQQTSAMNIEKFSTCLSEMKTFQEDKKQMVMAFLNSELDRLLLEFKQQRQESCQIFKDQQQLAKSIKFNFRFAANASEKANDSSHRLISLKTIECGDHNSSQESLTQYKKNSEREPFSKNSMMNESNQSIPKEQDKLIQRKSNKQTVSSPKKAAEHSQAEFEKANALQQQSQGSDDEDDDDDDEDDDVGEFAQIPNPSSPLKKKKKKSRNKYIPLEPNSSYQEIISNYKNVSNFNSIHYKSEMEGLDHNQIQSLNYLQDSPHHSPRHTLFISRKSTFPHLTDLEQQQSEQAVLEEKENNMSIKSPIIDRRIMMSDHKEVHNIQAAKKLQSFSSLALKKRNKLKSAVDLFVNSNNSTFKIYQDIRKEVESKVKGLNLEILENGGHFFKNNTFKYVFANCASDGYVFGEQGILTKKTRVATVVCLEDCYFATLQVKKYSQILAKQDKASLVKKRLFIIDTLKQNELQFENEVQQESKVLSKKNRSKSIEKESANNSFNQKQNISKQNENIAAEKMSKMAYYFQKRKYQAGETIFREGEAPKYIYLIKKGEVELTREEEIYVNQKELMKVTVRVAKITKKEYFGDCDLFFMRQRYYTAVATTPASIYYCESTQFMKLAEEIKNLIEGFVEKIKKREEYRQKAIQDMKSTMNFAKNLNKLKTKMDNKKLNKSRSASQAQSQRNSQSPQNRESQNSSPLGQERAKFFIMKTENNSKEEEDKPEQAQKLKRRTSGIMDYTSFKVDMSKKNSNDDISGIEKNLMTKSSFYSPRLKPPNSKKLENEGRNQKSPLNLRELMHSQNSSVHNNQGNEQIPLAPLTHFQNPTNQISEQHQKSQPSPRQPEKSYLKKRGKDLAHNQDFELSLSQQFQGSRRESQIKSVGEERLRKSEIKTQRTEQDLPQIQQKNLNHVQSAGGLPDLKYLDQSNILYMNTQEAFKLHQSKTQPRWGSVQHERIAQKKGDEQMKEFKEELFASSERLKKLREGNKVNTKLLKNHRKNQPKETIHQQFMHIREICTINDPLFQKEERVQEQRVKDQLAEIQTGIRKKPHHTKMPSEICSIYSKLSMMEDREGFKQSNLLDTDLVTSNPVTLHVKSKKNNQELNKYNIQNMARMNLNEANRNNFSASKDKHQYLSHQTSMSLSDFQKGTQNTNHNQQGNLKQKEVIEKQSQSSNTQLVHSQSACLKTASLFLYNDQSDCIRNLQSSNKNLPDVSKAMKVSDYNPKLIDQMAKETFYKADPGDSSPKQRLNTNFSQYSASNLHNIPLQQIIPDSARIHSEKFDQMDSQNSTLNNFNYISYHHINKPSTTGASNHKTQNAAASPMRPSKVTNFQNSAIASANNFSQHIQFDDKQVEKIEKKGFDIKKHYLGSNKITIVNHMQKPMIYKKG